MSRNRRLLGAVVVFSALALAMPATNALAGQGRGRGHAKTGEKAEKGDKGERGDKDDRGDKGDKGERKDDRKDGTVKAIVLDRDGHIRVIREFAHGGSLPPGLAKRESLPPGLRRQLRERGALPPGLQARLMPVPPVLVTRLPPVPPYYQRYFAGDDFIVVDTRTNRIVAIIRDVWR
jgi:hypothetical protein